MVVLPINHSRKASLGVVAVVSEPERTSIGNESAASAMGISPPATYAEEYSDPESRTVSAVYTNCIFAARRASGVTSGISEKIWIPGVSKARFNNQSTITHHGQRVSENGDLY